jgi:uncharacterized protein with GYD domain
VQRQARQPVGYLAVKVRNPATDRQRQAKTGRAFGVPLVLGRSSPLILCPSEDHHQQGGPAMPTYISLVKYTHQGISTIREGPNRLEANKEILNRYGVEMKAFYLTMGRYDMVTISEAPDDAAAAKAALTVGSAGNLTTETLRAFTEDEYREIVAALP